MMKNSIDIKQVCQPYIDDDVSCFCLPFLFFVQIALIFFSFLSCLELTVKKTFYISSRMCCRLIKHTSLTNSNVLCDRRLTLSFMRDNPEKYKMLIKMTIDVD